MYVSVHEYVSSAKSVYMLYQARTYVNSCVRCMYACMYARICKPRLSFGVGDAAKYNRAHMHTCYLCVQWHCSAWKHDHAHAMHKQACTYVCMNVPAATVCRSILNIGIP